MGCGGGWGKRKTKGVKLPSYLYSNIDRMAKTKTKPVMLGTLEIGARFIYLGSEWKVLQQNWTRERKPSEGKAKCQKVNTPVILNLVRSDFVLPA